MTIVALEKKIRPLIPKGMTLQGFLKGSLILQLQEVNKKIAVFEGAYNKAFLEFSREWQKAKEPLRSAYETEGDYMDWEALETYKRDLMTTIHSL